MSQRLCPAHDRIRVRQGLSDAVLYDGISETRTKASFYGIIFRDASGHADWTDGIQNRVCQLEAMEEGFEGEISVELFLCHKTIPGEEKKARH